MATNCTVEFDTGCVTCPEITPVPGNPGTVTVIPDFGWNAGANSVDILDGNVRLRFTVAQATAMVVGLRRLQDGREAQFIPGRIRRGWRIRSVSNVVVADVFESGVSKTSSIVIDTCDVLEIARYGSVCEYRINGVLKRSVRNMHSVNGNPLNGPVFVTACLYASNDVVGPHTCSVD